MKARNLLPPIISHLVVASIGFQFGTMKSISNSINSAEEVLTPTLDLPTIRKSIASNAESSDTRSTITAMTTITNPAGAADTVLDHKEDGDGNHNEADVHILYCLSGNASGFLSEFSVSLKSVLLNAPLDSNMTVHIISDRDAHEGIGPILFNATKLNTFSSTQKEQLVSKEVPC